MCLYHIGIWKDKVSSIYLKEKFDGFVKSQDFTPNSKEHKVNLLGSSPN